MTEPPAWWSGPALTRSWSLIAERLEREGLTPRGRVTVTGLDREEQRALSDLLGISVLGDRVRVDLGELDRRLRERARTGLVAAAGQVLGRPLTDRPAIRADRAARAEAPFEAYAAWRATHPEAAACGLDGRLDLWLAGLRRDGVLGREADPVALVEDALVVLWHQRGHLAGRRTAPTARTELAARLLGDAHALDDDRRLGAVILRAIRCLHRPADVLAGSGTADPPESDPEQPASRSVREEWELLGVLTDRVSSTCLTLGLRPAGADPVARRVALHSEQDAVQHLTWRDLDAGLAFAPDQGVLVCENPRVLEAAAESSRHGLGIVCTSGRPALVTVEVLARLRSAGARLWCHGDFDWPGVAMADELARTFGARPWRMSADDYQSAPGRLPLIGRRVEAGWDAELSPAMEARGVAVHEEALLPALIDSLAELARTT